MKHKTHIHPFSWLVHPFRAFLVIAALYLLPTTAHSATLEVTASGNTASISRGGAYANIHVSNSNRPTLNILNNNLTLNGTGSGQTMITGAATAVLNVNSTRLALGSATSAPGGFIAGDIRLSNNGQLRIYGNGASSYALIANSPAGGTVTGQGSILLRSGAFFKCAGIGTSAAPLTSLTLNSESSLTIQNGLYASELISSEAKISITSGSAILETVTFGDSGSSLTASDNITIRSLKALGSGSIEAKTGNLRITGGFRPDSGHTSLTAGGNIEIVNTSSIAAGAGSFSATADGEIWLENVNGNFTVITAGKDALVKGGTIAGQTFSSQNLTLDSSQGTTSVTADSLSASRIAQRGANSAILETGSIRTPGAISGNENFIIHASGSVTAASLTAGVIRANTLSITSGALSLLSRQASVIKGNAQIHGTGADSGAFTTLAVGGALELAGASLTGNSLQAGPVSVGGNAESSLSVSSLQTSSLTVGGNASAKLAAGSFGPDMTIAAGKNGQAALGASSTAWLSQIMRGHHAESDTALGLNSPVELTGAALDPAASHPHAAANSFVFNPGSFLVVNAEKAMENLNPNGMITAPVPSTATVANGAKLILEGVSANSVYGVLGRNISVAYGGNAAWAGENLATTSHLIAVEKIPGRDGWFRTSQILAADRYPDLDPGIHPPLNQGVGSGQLGTEFDHYNSRYAGVRFLSRAGSTTYMDHDYRGAVETMESAVRAPILGGVPQMTLAAANAALEAGEARAAFINDGEEDGGRSYALWLLPLYKALNTREWPANNFNYNLYGSLGGIAGGCDWTIAGLLRFGIMASMGGGYAQSWGDLAETTNNMGFAGIGAYAGINLQNFGLAADINYTGSWSSLKQELPARMRMADLTGDLTGQALSASLKALARIDLWENWNLEPYAGARYAWLVTDNYTIYSNGALLDGKKIGQSIWTLPLGCRLNGEFFTGSGWRIRPDLNVGIIPAAGDLSAKTSVRFTGVPGKGEVETQMMDYTIFAAGLGLEAARGNFTLGLAAELKMGMHGEETNISGLFRYEF